MSTDERGRIRSQEAIADFERALTFLEEQMEKILPQAASIASTRQRDSEVTSAVSEPTKAAIGAMLYCLHDAHRMVLRARRDPAVAANDSVTELCAKVDTATHEIHGLLEPLPGVKAATREEIRIAAREDTALLWEDQHERLTALRERLSAANDCLAENLRELADYGRYVNSGQAAGLAPEQDPRAIKAQLALTSAHEEVIACGEVITELDTHPDLIDLAGLRPLVGLRELAVDLARTVTEALADVPEIMHIQH